MNDLEQRLRTLADTPVPAPSGIEQLVTRVRRRHGRRRAVQATGAGVGLLLLLLVAVPVLSRVATPEVVLDGRGGPPDWPLEVRYEIERHLESLDPPVTVHELGGRGWEDWLEVSWPENAVEGTVRRLAGDQVSEGTVPVLDIDDQPFASLRRAREALLAERDPAASAGTPDAFMSPRWTDQLAAGMTVVEDDLPELRRQVAGDLELDAGTLVARRIAGCEEPSRCFEVRVVALQGAHVLLFLERTRDGAELPELRLRVTHLRAVEAIEGPRVADTVLDLPARGDTEPAWLDDGTPVFVVHHEDGEVAVVEAISTHRVGDKLVGWCASSRTFDDPHHGSQWAPGGEYLTGPAPTGLPTYAVEVEGDRVRVGVRRAPTARDALHDKGEPFPGMAGPSCSWQGHDGPGVHDLAEAPWPTIPAEELGDRDGPVFVRGTAVVVDGSAWVCRQASGTPPRCPAGSPRLSSAHAPPDYSVYTGTFLVTADDELYAFGELLDME